MQTYSSNSTWIYTQQTVFTNIGLENDRFHDNDYMRKPL